MDPDSFDSDNLLLGIKLRTLLLKFALCNFSFSILFSSLKKSCSVIYFYSLIEKKDLNLKIIIFVLLIFYSLKRKYG